MPKRATVVLCVSMLGAIAAPAMADPPVVVSVVREGPEHNKASQQQWTIHFDQGVYGLTANNIQVKRYPDGYGQPTDVNFADGNSFVGVGVGTPSGTGTVAVHLINVGNIQNAAHEFMQSGDMGEEMGYYVDRQGPAPIIYPDPLTGGVTSQSPIRFLLDIDEAPIKDLTGSSVQLSGTAGATTATIQPDGGDPHDRVIEVSGMAGPGSVVVNLSVGAFADELGNPSQAATFVAGANTAQYTGAGTPQAPGDPLPITPLPVGPALPAPAPPPAPGSPGTPPPGAPKVVVGKGKLALKLSSKGRLSIPVTCTADGSSCTAAVTVSAGAGKRKHKLCTATKAIAAGRRVSVVATCTKRARREIGKAGRKGLSIAVVVAVTDGAGHQATAAGTGKASAAT